MFRQRDFLWLANGRKLQDGSVGKDIERAGMKRAAFTGPTGQDGSYPSALLPEKGHVMRHGAVCALGTQDHMALGCGNA